MEYSRITLSWILAKWAVKIEANCIYLRVTSSVRIWFNGVAEDVLCLQQTQRMEAMIFIRSLHKEIKMNG